jgi:hypothetical protein
MESGLLGFFLIALLVANALAVYIGRDWRWVLGGLALQYLLAFLLITPVWPLELAAVKLVGGWMAAAVLGTTRLNLIEQPREAPNRFPNSPTFLALTTLLVMVIVIGAAPALASWSRQFTIELAWSGLFLIGIGLLQVSLSDLASRIIIGLLTLLTGFEILYATVETSILVAGLLAVLHLGVALVGSYLMLAPQIEEPP